MVRKNRFNILLLIVIVSLLSIISCKKDKKTELDALHFGKNYIKYCEDYASFFVKEEYLMENNVWGYIASSCSTYTQCIFHDSINHAIFGWEWNINSRNELPSYPRVEYGWNAWRIQSTTQKLPRKINSLSSIIVSFDKKFSAEGYFNTSFDICFTNSDTSKVENRTAELMIWLDCTLVPSTDLTISNLTVNHETYDFYKNTTWNPFPYMAFVKKDSSWNGQLDIMPFITYMVENKHISSNDYLVDIEFGNEIWSGNGKMELKDYNITIK